MEMRGDAKRELIEATGLLFEEFGLARSRGLVWGLLYFSSATMSLDEIVASLQISKGSASTAARDLLGLNAIRQVRVEGDRKDYFEAHAKPQAFAQNIYNLVIMPRFGRFDAA